jgi:hypothetical protein
MKLPKARTENLLEQNLKNETLIYDLAIDKAFNLNETLSVVYKACGQNSTFDELKRKHKFTDDFIFLALDELKRNNLLADEYVSPFESVNRREVIKKVGLATMLALPLITGLVAPKAVNAASDSGSGPADSNFLPFESYCNTQPGSRPCSTSYCAGAGDSSLYPGRCCSPATVGTQIILFTGESSSEVDRSPTYFPVGTVPSYRECYSICCNGNKPSGGCTYALYEEEGFDPNEAPGYVAYRSTCTCAC